MAAGSHTRLAMLLLGLAPVLFAPLSAAAQIVDAVEIAVHPDGAVVVAMGGDLWLLPAADAVEHFAAGGSGVAGAVALTRGEAHDRAPAWLPGDSAVVFVRESGGDSDLWTVRTDAGSTPGAERLTELSGPVADPSARSDGTLVFVRGAGALADLWLREPSGEIRLIADEPGAARHPAWSPDGERIVYVQGAGERYELRVREVAPADAGSVDPGPSDPRSLPFGRRPAFPSWGPDGRLVFSEWSDDGGVWVAGADDDAADRVSTARARARWVGGGDRLLLQELAPPEPGYNGDPDRIDRVLATTASRAPRVWLLAAPAAPAGVPADAVAASDPRSLVDRAAARFDRLYATLHELYARPETEVEWTALRARWRAIALSASTEEELAAALYGLARERPAARPERTGAAAVSSAHPAASAAGTEILAAGGNVVDAAVAVSFALGVVEPDASGIGGYGEMLIHLDGVAEPVVIEFLTRVPERGGLLNGELTPGSLPADGPVFTNVPGTVRGMELAWRRYGSGAMPWSRLLEPAIRLAEDGFVLDEAFPTTLARERDRYLQWPAATELFFPGGEVLRAGDTFRNPDLAATLRQIAEGGADAFYEGDLARRIVEDLRGKGSPLLPSDFARYYAVERRPVVGTYRENTVYSAAPAVSGGASLVARLLLLQNAAPATGRDDPAGLHALIEAAKLAPSTRGLVADPGLWPVNLEPLTDPEAAATRWARCFDPEAASGPAELRRDGVGPGVLACELPVEAPAAGWGDPLLDCVDDPRGCRAQGTTAFAVGDANGNLVSVTQTLGTWGGSFYVSPGLGFLYNDKLLSYAGGRDDYGARVPFARNSTSITPTLLFRGTGPDARPFAALGAAGNAWIGAAVYRMVTGLVDLGLGPQEALELPRLLVGVRQDPADRSRVRSIEVQYEEAIDPATLARLRAFGHELVPISTLGELRMGYGAAVVVGPDGVRAGGDPRRSGAAATLPSLPAAAEGEGDGHSSQGARR